MSVKKSRKRRDPQKLLPVIEIISRRLQELRLQRKLSQEAIAKILGVTQAAVSRWESPDHPAMPSAAELATLARHFEISADFLTGLSAYETPLPPRQALVDLRLLDSLTQTNSKQELSALLKDGLKYGAVYSSIPEGAAVLSHEEVNRKVREVDHHLRAIDEDLWRDWARSVLS